MKCPGDRWIGYAVVNREHVAMSRSHYRDLANESAFGAALRDGRRILVRESGVRRWLRDGCRSMAQLVNQFETRVGSAEGMRGSAMGGRADSNDDYAPVQSALESSAAAAHTAALSAVRPPGRCMTGPRPERHRGNGEAGGTPLTEKPARSGRAVVSCGPVFDPARRPAGIVTVGRPHCGIRLSGRRRFRETPRSRQSRPRLRPWRPQNIATDIDGLGGWDGGAGD
jgi:hypothetical protein